MSIDSIVLNTHPQYWLSQHKMLTVIQSPKKTNFHARKFFERIHAIRCTTESYPLFFFLIKNKTHGDLYSESTIVSPVSVMILN